jgi:hypothetical protein
MITPTTAKGPARSRSLAPTLGPGSGNARLTWCPACGRPVGHTTSYALLPHLQRPVRASHDDGKIYELLQAQAGQRD